MRIMTIVTTMVLCLLLFFSAAALALDINIGDGDIRIRTGIEAPPQVEFAGPPELVPIPGRYVYFVPDIDFDLFFYQRHWFRPYKKHWFRSDNYAGPWEHVREAPAPLIDIPQDYRTIPPGYYRIPYGELRNNWERWEREKYWDRRVEDRIGIGAPPPVEFARPPELVPIPGRYVYFVPDMDSDLFFYQGRWFRPYKGSWFRSEQYAGPWEHVREVPSPLIDLPHDYRTIPPGYYRIPYGELRNNWERWERERYWDRRGEDRGIRERERERDRERDVRPERERDHPEERDVQPERERNRY